MTLPIAIPRYTSKDVPIMVFSMGPMALLINYFLFDDRYFESFRVFLPATLVTFIVLCLAFLVYGVVAISLRNRFPSEEELFKRLSICVMLFVLMTGVYLSIVTRAYDLFRFLGYEFNETGFTKCYAALVVMNIFLTFLNEGVSRFENYKITTLETEQLKREYMQSQLLGLKSQMNPHFLFNSLNSLSSLIHEDAEGAELFLDHMSKVYRYLLRNHDEQLVSLGTELNFIQSYYHLLKVRHADGLSLHIDVAPHYEETMIPPLTLQMIIENALNSNTASRKTPLHIDIRAAGRKLIISNTVNPKHGAPLAGDESLDNIIKKFRLLVQKNILIELSEGERIIQIPIIHKTAVPA